MEQDHLLSNRTYDLLNRIVTIILPGLAVLYAALAQAWGWEDVGAVLATIAAITVFGGVLIKFSDKSWNNSESKYDGELITTGSNPDTGIPDLALNIKVDPSTLAAKNTIRLKSLDQSA